jgi:hypothetical protein
MSAAWLSSIIASTVAWAECSFQYDFCASRSLAVATGSTLPLPFCIDPFSIVTQQNKWLPR